MIQLIITEPNITKEQIGIMQVENIQNRQRRRIPCQGPDRQGGTWRNLAKIKVGGPEFGQNLGVFSSFFKKSKNNNRGCRFAIAAAGWNTDAIASEVR